MNTQNVPTETVYLELLAEQFPSIESASTEIVKLQALLNLPKETEHFLSDIHGEHEAFLHLLRSSSGSLRRRIDELFGDELSRSSRNALTTLIYYPEQKLPLLLEKVEDEAEWYRITLRRMLRLGRDISAKYPRSQVRKSLPDAIGSTIEELLHPQENNRDRTLYYQSLLETLIRVGQGRRFVIALAYFIQRFAISQLHIIGDIYDRGPGAHLILDKLLDYHSVDIQWGNHDIVWMGAAAGGEACIANVLRLSLRYGNTETLENGYGISLLPLASLAMDVYGDDECTQFLPRDAEDRVLQAVVDDVEQRLLARMQKAISIIQFKLEGQIVQRRPHYNMSDRLLLDKIDLEKGIVTIDGQAHELLDKHFPTLNSADPYALSTRERQVMSRLSQSFLNSEKLQRHVRLLYTKGGMYLVHNGHLLYHGCISLDEDGSFTKLIIGEKVYQAKSYMDRVDQLARQGYFSADPDLRQYGQDAMWYLWSGARSPLFGKSKMATFERYFVADPATYKELQNPYYKMRNDEPTVRKILAEFGLDPDTGRIINGHVPVRVKRGQRPIFANGKLLVIDGGMAKAYQDVTGIAGYTLIANSRGLLLAEHKPFVSVDKAIHEERDVLSTTESIATYPERQFVRHTDRGLVIQQRIAALSNLLDAYRDGLIKEAA
jgi:fructose-1,6-bisphosphatase-3